MKTLLIEGDKTFRVTVPDAARITFGPWSPPKADGGNYGRGDSARTGTLRIYAPGPKASESILAVFSGVTSFRDVSVKYAEMVTRETGAAIWNSDEHGFEREEKVKSGRAWAGDPTLLLAGGGRRKKTALKNVTPKP
jgi:hypothetical protein